MTGPNTPPCIAAAEERPADNAEWVNELLNATSHLNRAKELLAGRDFERYMQINQIELAAFAVALREGGPR